VSDAVLSGGKTLICVEAGSHAEPIPAALVWRVALAVAPGAMLIVVPSAPSRDAG